MTSDRAIHAEGLVKHFGTTRALDGVDLEVEGGTVFALLGPNGAGKTTAVRILTTLLKPDAGRATVAGFDVVRDADKLKSSIGLAGQSVAIDEYLTGRENIVMIGRLYHLSARDAARRTDELLQQFDLADAANRIAKTYSGGMRRRLDLAASLVVLPPVLFLDEPTTGLDPEARVAMWEEVQRLAAQESLTILLTTHYLEEADQLADRLAIVSRGRIIVEGTPEELKSGLQGELVTVDLQNGQAGDAVAVVERFEGARETAADGQQVRTRVPNGAQAIPALLSALEGAGIAVASVATSRPSLDDVYLHYTGREFSADDAEGHA